MIAHHIFEYRDVTDNKTSDSISSYKDDILSTSYRNMSSNELLHYETERLKTFENGWPLPFLDKYVLARTGMYYTGVADTTKCSFCGVEIGHWEETDHPVDEHMKWSPNCPLLKRRQTNNIPINEAALAPLLPQITYDVCGGTQPSSGVARDSSTSTSSFANPDHPEYIIEGARLRSFSEWPRTLKQKPHELAEAGFFYTGTGDRVMCFSCGGGLKDWDEDDDPWEEHALWFKNCNYLKLMKGQKYIDTINAKRNSDRTVENSVEQQNGEKNELKLAPAFENVAGNLSAFNVQEIDDQRPSDDKSCKICYAADYNTAFMPCGHVVACVKCAASVTKCPVCREPISNVTRLYFS